MAKENCTSPKDSRMNLHILFEGINQPALRILLLGSFTLLLAIHLWLWIKRSWKVLSPPGPFPWPVIGNAAQMGSTPHIYFTRLAQKYGDVFQIKLGCRTVVVLNGDAIRQALIQKGPDFAGRPDFASFQIVSNGKSMAFGNYNDLWKAHRKIAHTTVRNFSTGNIHTKRAFENHVLSEIKELLNLFLRNTKQLEYFQPMTYLVVSIANIMSAVCFGKRYVYDDAEFRQVIGRNDQFTKTVGAGSIVDVMPWLQYFPNPMKTMFGNFKDLNKEFFHFILNKVVEHRKTIQLSTIRDMTDAFIMAMDQGLSSSAGILLDKEYVPPIVCDIFGASQDTLSTALQWIILILVRYPHVQRRLQEEVDRVVGRTQLPTLKDQPNLPYVMAFIYEVMRFTSFVPVTIPHSTIRDTSVLGYSIPKDTVVFVNQWSINHNPAKWETPEIFEPQRFLDQDMALNKDLTSNVFIFSLGKRRCIGEDMSKMLLFLFTSVLAHQCHFSSDPARSPPSMDYSYGLTLKPKAFWISVALRDNMDLLHKVVSHPLHAEKQED